jgi:hypothetical protein
MESTLEPLEELQPQPLEGLELQRRSADWRPRRVN